jgi:putative ABC transport system permease protein
VSPLTRKLWRDLGRHRAQFLAVTVTVFLGVVVFAASYDSFQNLQSSYDRTAVQFHFANLTAVGGDVATLAAEAAAQPGVAAIQERTVADSPLRVGDVKLLGRVVGLPADAEPAVNQVKVLQGSYLDPSREDAVLVEKHMAEHFGLVPGSTLEVFDGSNWSTLEVVGVVASPEYIWPARDRQDLITSPDNFGVVFAPETLARTLTSGPNQLAIYYDKGEPDAALTAALGDQARALGSTSVFTRAEQPSNAALSEDIQGFAEMAMFFPILFILAAAMAAYVMISRLVHAQRPHIGVLRANGFSRAAVLRHYLGYGVLPGIAGAVPGAVVGVFLAGLITRLYTDMLAVPVTVIRFHPATLVAGVVLGLVATALAALAPALFASRVQPAEAMRGETPGGRGRASLAERLLPPLRRLPIRWRMVLRGIERNPRRTLYTALGVVLSLVLVLVSWGMIDTIEHLMNLQFRQIEQQDASVYFEGPVGTSQVDSLLTIPGVAAAEPALEVPVSLSLGALHYDTTLEVLEQQTQMHRFLGVDGAWLQLPADGMLVGQDLRQKLGAEVGDVVTIQASGLGDTLSVPIAGFVDEPLGTLAYVSRQAAEQALGTALPATSALIRYSPGADPAAIRAAVTDLPGVAAFEDAKALFTALQRYMGLFYGLVGVMLVFGGAMAFALIFNSMTVNISERSREVATLLAIGTRRRSISLLVTVENLTVTLLGIPVGLVAGYWVSWLAMRTYSSDMFSFNLYMRPSTLALSALAVVVVALLSGWPGLRALRRLDIPAIVKERSS